MRREDEGEKLTAPMPLLAPVTRTIFPRRREALKMDMMMGVTRKGRTMLKQASDEYKCRLPNDQAMAKFTLVVGWPWHGDVYTSSRAQRNSRGWLWSCRCSSYSAGNPYFHCACLCPAQLQDSSTPLFT